MVLHTSFGGYMVVEMNPGLLKNRSLGQKICPQIIISKAFLNKH